MIFMQIYDVVFLSINLKETMIRNQTL